MSKNTRTNDNYEKPYNNQNALRTAVVDKFFKFGNKVRYHWTISPLRA